MYKSECNPLSSVLTWSLELLYSHIALSMVDSGRSIIK